MEPVNTEKIIEQKSTVKGAKDLVVTNIVFAVLYSTVLIIYISNSYSGDNGMGFLMSLLLATPLVLLSEIIGLVSLISSIIRKLKKQSDSSRIYLSILLMAMAPIFFLIVKLLANLFPSKPFGGA